MSTFQPRMLADGSVCCSQPYTLCPKCAAWHDANEPYTAALRAKASSDSHVVRVAEDSASDDIEERLRSMREFRSAFSTIVTTASRAAAQPASRDVDGDDIYLNPPEPYTLALRARREGR